MRERSLPRVLLLTGDTRRHRFVASVLHNAVRLVGIVTEKKRAAVGKNLALTDKEQEIIDRHLSERGLVEERLLGAPDFPVVDRLDLPEGGANSAQAFDWVQGHKPEFVVLYGTSIIKPPLLSAFEGRMINMHLGLSPYYRGAGTNFWPLVDRNPACVGTTIHLAVQKVDAGSILAQVRPVPEYGDRAHELGTKAIIAGVGTLAKALKRYAEGRLTPASQNLGQGKVYKRSDFSAEAVLKMWANVDAGMINHYADQYDVEISHWPIQELSSN